MSYGTSNTSQHAATPNALRFGILGRLLFSFVVFFVAFAVLRILGIEGTLSVVLAVAVWALVEGAVYYIKVRFRKRAAICEMKSAAAKEAQTTAARNEQIDEARKRGDFDMFGKSK